MSLSLNMPCSHVLEPACFFASIQDGHCLVALAAPSLSIQYKNNLSIKIISVRKQPNTMGAVLQFSQTTRLCAGFIILQLDQVPDIARRGASSDLEWGNTPYVFYWAECC